MLEVLLQTLGSPRESSSYCAGRFNMESMVSPM